MASFEFLAIILTGLGLTASLVYYASILNNQTKAKQRELVFQKLSLYTLEYTKAFAELRKYKDWETPEEWSQKYGPDSNPEAWSNWLYILRIFNLAGVLLQEKAADPELIFKLYPPTAIVRVWEQVSPVIIHDREASNYPEHFEPFEFLYNEVKRRYPKLTRIS